jgi:hypothetical protein
MTEKTWETLKIQYCQHVDEKVGLQAQVVYPPDMMPDQPARILSPELHLGWHEPHLRPV